MAILLPACGKTFYLAGTAYDAAGVPAAGIAIELLSMDDAGSLSTALDTTVTDQNGRFEFEARSSLSPSMTLRALHPKGSLRAFAFAEAPSDIHPLTDALVRAVIEITAPSEGKSLSDFSSIALARIATQALASIPPDLDLSNESQRLHHLKTSYGRAIADASRFELRATSSTGFDPPGNTSTPAFNTTVRCATKPVFELTGPYFVFDLVADGQVCDGYASSVRDGYDLAFKAAVVNDTFSFHGLNEFPEDASSALLQDARTLVLGPHALSSGVTLTRKMYVPENKDYVRFLDTFTNPTTSERTLNYRVTGDLGSDLTTTLFARGGDASIVKPTDRFAGTFDTVEFDASVGYVWQDNSGIALSTLSMVGASAPDLFEWNWNALNLAPGGVKSILYFSALSSLRDPGEFANTLRALADDPDMSNMTASEILTVVNFAPNRGNIYGSQGSVVAGSTVTVTNLTQNVSAQVPAKSDWSFFVPLQASPGDTVTIVSSDGLSETLTVP